MGASAEEARPGAAERVSTGRRGQFKATLKREEEAVRRRDALAAQQTEARSNRLSDVRRIAMESLLNDSVNDVEQEVEVEEEVEEEDADAMVDTDAAERKASSQKMCRLRRLHRTLFFARQLQVPDWMCEVPEELASWLLLVKPEGDRCLLLSDGGHVEVRRKNGYVLERFSDSRLPRGLTILDVVCMEGASSTAMQTTGGEEARAKIGTSPEEPAGCDEEEQDPGVADVDMGGSSASRGRGYPSRADGRGKGGPGKGGSGKGAGKSRRGRPKGDRKYAVMDVLVWGDVDLACADAECRMFWLESRFSEISEKPSRRARVLQLIPATPATPQALTHAYHSDVGYMKDSILFLHREGHYSISEPVTPLALQWRDRQISRFVVDTKDQHGEVLPEKQAVVLELRPGGRLRTADHFVVAQLSEEELARAQGLAPQGKATKSRMLRCEVEGVDVAARKLHGAVPVAHVAARSRVWADSWGRIVFQHLNRQREVGHISFDVLLQATNGGLAA